MAEDNVAIRVSHVSKTFKLPREKNSSIKGALINFNKRGYDTQTVLRDVSFEVKPGEFFGIVGRNGSGKSTLLKMLAGIYGPTAGNIEVNGKLTPFIELGVGFNAELTGRENVFLNGALLGFNRKEMAAMYDDIVAFAELEKFMDQKLKNYSSGMQVRLAFSIAIRARTDILLIDEVLAVGDEAFQRKCYDYFYKLKRDGKTVVLVTHDMGAVKNFCDRAILIKDGDIQIQGSPDAVAQEYSIINLASSNRGVAVVSGERYGSQRMTVTDCRAIYQKVGHFSPEDKINLRITVLANEDVSNPVVGITVKDLAGREILVTNTKTLGLKTGDFAKGEHQICSFSFDNVLTDGSYLVTPALTNEDTTEVFDSVAEGGRFETRGWKFPTGIVQTPVVFDWEHKKSGRKK